MVVIRLFRMYPSMKISTLKPHSNQLENACQDNESNKHQQYSGPNPKGRFYINRYFFYQFIFNKDYYFGFIRYFLTVLAISTAYTFSTPSKFALKITHFPSGEK
jgi:hypothetical protein